MSAVDEFCKIMGVCLGGILTLLAFVWGFGYLLVFLHIAETPFSIISGPFFFFLNIWWYIFYIIIYLPWSYVLPWTPYLFWKFLGLMYICLKFFIFNILPYGIIIGCCYFFDFYVFDQILTLSKLKSEMAWKENKDLSFYADRLKKMKSILLKIFGFLLALRFVTWFAFPDSLIMEVVTMVNVGILMGMVLIGKWQRENRYNWLNNAERDVLMYNCILIFISAFIIDDIAGMMTGKTLINFNISGVV